MKVESWKFHFYFLNSEFSFNNPSIISKFLQEELKTLPDGSVSQNLDLGSQYFIMLCRNFFNYFFHCILRFMA